MVTIENHKRQLSLSFAIGATAVEGANLVTQSLNAASTRRAQMLQRVAQANKCAYVIDTKVIPEVESAVFWDTMPGGRGSQPAQTQAMTAREVSYNVFAPEYGSPQACPPEIVGQDFSHNVLTAAGSIKPKEIYSRDLNNLSSAVHGAHDLASAIGAQPIDISLLAVPKELDGVSAVYVVMLIMLIIGNTKNLLLKQQLR